MDEDIKRDFDGARLRHILFKAKLRSFLYGSGSDEEPVRDADICGLGKWIKDTALARFGHHPEVHELDRMHRLVHVRANTLMDLYQTGQVDEAQRRLREINPITDQILQLINTLEQKLRKEAR